MQKEFRREKRTSGASKVVISPAVVRAWPREIWDRGGE